ncbi:hypothetical protein HK098_005759 [Nowakowskiella sp. JEL0407]|nr:hypothetical protein HK098_005759 [Nowakowskiella sp. JEL0407]
MVKKNKSNSQQPNLGASLMNSRFKQSKNLKLNPDGSIKHTTDIVEGPSWLAHEQSVTAENDLDAFLSTAQLKGTSFTAERLGAVKLISHSSSNNPLHNSSLLSLDDGLTEKQKELQELYKDALSIPRRPHWNKKMTTEQLVKDERDSFLVWRRTYAKLEEDKGVLLTPYERNLEIWRQLWRVIERSQLVVQIVDARNPELFRSSDLEKYVLEVAKFQEVTKSNLLLLNKADMLTQKQRRQWGTYFKDLGVEYLWFSAKWENEKLEKELVAGSPVDEPDVTENVEEQIEDENDEVEFQFNVKKGNMYVFGDEGDEADGVEVEDAVVPIVNDDPKIVSETVIEDNEHEQTVSPSSEENAEQVDSEESEDSDDEHEEIGKHIDIDEENEDELSRITSVSELIAILQSRCPKPAPSENDSSPKSIIGFVGYPNVGKSSTLNALLGCKKVSVASTPGKTKHFQTLHLDSNTILCDCPGLVFPSFATTKAEMVVNGILPIDQLRDHIASVNLVVDRIPKRVLEAVYGIVILMRDEEGQVMEGNEELDGGIRKPTGEELLKSYAIGRGYTKAGQGNPDEARAARYILKDYVNGKLVFVEAPSSYSDEESLLFNKDAHQAYLTKLLKKRRKNPIVITPQPMINTPNHGIADKVGSTIDSEFLSGKDSMVHARTKGKFASDDFKRVTAGESGVKGKKKHHHKADKRNGKVRTKWTAVE